MKTVTTLISLYVLAATAQDTSTSTCEIYGGLSTDKYWVTNWVAEYYAPEGQQCITLDGSDGTSVSWHSNFTWS